MRARVFGAGSPLRRPSVAAGLRAGSFGRASLGRVRRVSCALICGRTDGVSRAHRSVISLCAALLGALVFVGAPVLLAAPSAYAAEACPNAASRQGPSVALPECRVYEQVTPVDKGDAVDLFGGGEEGYEGVDDGGYPSEDGNKFLLYNMLSSIGPEGDSGLSGYLFTRGPKGWTGKGLGQPVPGPQIPYVGAFSADLSQVAINDRLGAYTDLLKGEPSGFSVENLAGPVGGPYTALTLLTGSAAESEPIEIAGASSDFSHVYLESNGKPLVPAAAAQDEGSRALYEAVDGQLRLVNLTSAGTLVSPCGAILGQGGVTADGLDGGTHNAVSEDGSKVIFTAPDPTDRGGGAGCWNYNVSPQENAPQLYMRVDDATTTTISAPEAGVSDPTGEHPAVYAGASANDSKIFFLSQGELTAGDTTHRNELYEYDTEAPEGKRLTRISGGASGTTEGNVDFVGAISRDGSTVYFTAFGALAPGASVQKEEQQGWANLYRYDTNTKKTTFIARIGSEDYPLVGGESGDWDEVGALENTETYGRPRDLLALDEQANWYTTGDGRYLVFGSLNPLTDYDSTKAPGVACHRLTRPDGEDPQQCVELFRYDAKAEEKGEAPIVCVSCGPPGSHPTSQAEFTRSVYNDAVPGGEPPRPISEDGQHVFFDTSSALTPEASENKLQVYEWHDGTISLISPAGDPQNSWFEGSSADGSNVFIGTHAQLAPEDIDDSGDLYDARVDGGFAGLAPTECTGTGCQGVPAAPPIFATPSSVTFEGVGNFPPESKTAVKPSKSFTKAQKLAKALGACHKDRVKRTRALCETRAKKKYGSAHKSTKVNRRGK